MRLEILDDRGCPLVVEASRVVAYADGGTPIAAIYRRAPGAYACLRAGDSRFREGLDALGVFRTVVVDAQRLRGLEEVGNLDGGVLR